MIKPIIRGVILGTLALAAIKAYETFRPQSADDAVIASTITPASGTTKTTVAATVTPVGGDFDLIDHDGKAVTVADYPGLKLAFFGFTHCPDICPAGLQRMALVMKALGDDAAQVKPLFITVDPARDTPEVMKDYAGLYDDRITGLTGDDEQIKTVLQSFRVYAAKDEPETPAHDHNAHDHNAHDHSAHAGHDNHGAHDAHAGHVMPSYNVNHSGYTYLLNDAGEMITVFGLEDPIADMEAEIRKHM